MASKFLLKLSFMRLTQAFLIRKPEVLCINKYPDRSKKCNENIAAAPNKAKSYEKFRLFVMLLNADGLWGSIA